MILDDHLSWSSHTDMVANKLSKITGILNKLKYINPENALLSIYNCLFMCHINYGLLLWGTKSDKIFRIQKRCVRVIANKE